MLLGIIKLKIMVLGKYIFKLAIFTYILYADLLFSFHLRKRNINAVLNRIILKKHL